MAADILTTGKETGQDSISSMVQVKLRQNSVLSAIFKDVTQFATEGDKSISFPRRANSFQVQKLSGSQKGDAQESIFELDKLELTEEAHIQWVIKKFDQARAKVALLSESIDEATYQHGVSLDYDIYEIMKVSVAAANEIAGPISQAKIVDMITQANTIRMPRVMRSFVFSNASYGSLMKIDQFVDASKSNFDSIRTGQIGTLYGYPVFESDTLDAGEAYLAHRDALFYGFGASPELEDQKAIEYGTGSRRWVMDQLYGVKSANENKLLVRLS